MQYKIITPVHRNGEHLKIGSLIDLTEDSARELLKFGAIEEANLPYAKVEFKLNLTESNL